jgi:hypothetical protein
MIVQTINEHLFREAFKDKGRGDQFSYDGLGLLFDYLEQVSEDCESERIELDVIGLCCDFAEGTPEEIARDYAIDIDEVTWYLQQNSVIVGETYEGTIVYRQF